VDINSANGGDLSRRFLTRGGNVDDRSRVFMSAVIGAAAGALVGFLYLTERGRRVRFEIEPRLDDFIGELTRLRGTVQKARTAANEGWRSLEEITGRTETQQWDRSKAH
jgi:hypothetical protein